MEQQFAEITRDYDQSKTDYEALLAKKNQSEMSTDLEKRSRRAFPHARSSGSTGSPTSRTVCCERGGNAVGVVLGGGIALGAKTERKIYSEREIKSGSL